MPTTPRIRERGPFQADQLKDGDRYELSNGHPVYCHPSGRQHAGPNLSGGAVLETDPDVEWAGVDAGFAPNPGTLRAPDVAVAPAGDERGWIEGAPPLALEYAGPGQDEADLELKIVELLAAGTQQVWVVRLLGPRRVEVHRPDAPMQQAVPGEDLAAPGILRNPVPVEALYDRSASHRMVLRNLLQREGYESIEAILEQGIERGLKQGIEQGIARSILKLLEGRGLAVDRGVRERIEGCRDAAQLEHWLLRAARVQEARQLFD
jgi:Uma2 family endonuclease